jgi:hypothetical protein|tara:strand:+ start:1282 stop:1512 length:231 start_codon:yes stop_codon:yes gene_type:complete
MGRPTKRSKNDLPPLEEEAKAYVKKNRPKEKPLTSRRYLAGQALAGLLASGRGLGRIEEIKREAYNWADIMDDDDD